MCAYLHDHCSTSIVDLVVDVIAIEDDRTDLFHALPPCLRQTNE